METERKLATASRETLLTIIAEQQTIIEQLQQRIAALETRLSGRGSAGMPGNKPASSKRGERTAARKRRAVGCARQRMTPTERVEHAAAVCPTCGTALAGGWVQRTREVIELPILPVRVVEHVFLARICPLCRKRVVPTADLGGEVVGRQRCGINLVSAIATLREAGRLPVETIQWYLETFHHLHLSVGGIVAVLQRVATQGEQMVEQIQEHIRASPVVHADETGWREDGRNGYVWTFSTERERYFLRRGRGKEVVDEVLDGSFGGVLVSDFYAAYHHYGGVHQRCWAHLLRDIHELQLLYPTDTELATWATAVHALYEEAKAFVQSDPRQRQRLQLRCERRLLALCQPFLEDPVALQGKLCRRIERFIKELFVFVGDPAVPGTNNAAERSLRHLVTSRKISGGTRSPHGTTSKMTLSSLFGTWSVQGLNPFLACRNLLTSPRV